MMILIPALFVLALVLNLVFRVLGIFVPKSRNSQPRYDYDESEYIKNNVWTDNRACYNKKDFISHTYDFEGLKVNGLKDHKLFLGMGYGKDYMELPPVEKRATHNIKVYRK